MILKKYCTNFENESLINGLKCFLNILFVNIIKYILHNLRKMKYKIPGTEEILKAMKVAGLSPNSPESPIVYGISGLSPQEFHGRVYEVINPLFERHGLEFSLEGNTGILTINHTRPKERLNIFKIVPFQGMLPLNVRDARAGERPYTFDKKTGTFLTDSKKHTASYKDLAELLYLAANSASRYHIE